MANDMEVYLRKNVDGDFKDVKVSDSDMLYLLIRSGKQEFRINGTVDGEISISTLNGSIVIRPTARNIIVIHEKL